MSRANLSASLGLTMQEVKNGPPFPKNKSFMILLKHEIESKVLKPGIIYTEVTLKRALDKINQISVSHVSYPDLLETKDDIDLVKTLEVHQLKWRFTVYRCILQAKDERTFDTHVLSLTECAICSRIRLIKATMAQKSNLTQLTMQKLEHGLRGTDSCLRNVFINDCLKFVQSLAPLDKAEMKEFLVHKTAGVSRVHAVGDENEMVAALMKFSDGAFKTLDNPNLQVCIDNRCFKCCQKLAKQAMKVLEIPREYDIQDRFQPKTDLTRKDVWNCICGPQRGHFNKYQTYLLQNIRVGDMYNRDAGDLLQLWFKLTKRFIVDVELHGNSPNLARLDKLSKDITNEIFADPSLRFLKTIATHHDVDLFQTVQMLFEMFFFEIMALTIETAVRDMDFGVLIVFLAVIAEFFVSFNEITQYAVVGGCSELVPTFIAAVKDTFAGPVIAELNETGALKKFCNEIIHDHRTKDGIEEEWKDFLVYKKNKRKAVDTAEIQAKKNRSV